MLVAVDETSKIKRCLPFSDPDNIYIKSILYAEKIQPGINDGGEVIHLVSLHINHHD